MLLRVLINCKLTILDEVNVVFEGLSKQHTDYIIRKTKLMKKGAYMTPDVQLGYSDGKVSNFHASGRTYFYMLDAVLPMVEQFGYEIEVDDFRDSLPEIKHIDKNFMQDVGVELLDYQVEGANNVIDIERGMIDVATSGGKSFVAGAITKIYDQHLDMIVIVPTEKLVKQIHEHFTDFGLDIGCITKNMNPKVRKEQWNKKHMVCTWRLLNNNRSILERFGGFIYDEAHIMGDIMFSILSNELSSCMVRIGMTGTIPKDPHKRENIFCHIGGDALISVKPKKLQDAGIISTCDITMIPIEKHFEVDAINMEMIEEWEWIVEERWMHSNRDRLELISLLIKDYTPAPTLILCHKKLANNLNTFLNYDIIDGDTSEKVRETFYERLEKEDDYPLIATYDTVGTGTSINSIRRIFAIDLGKNDTRITQGIGRGLRKDGIANHLEVIDIYSKFVYTKPLTGRLNDFSFSGRKHLNERKRIYNELHYPFKIKDTIVI